MFESLNIKYLDNPLREYLLCFVILLLGFILKRLFANILSKQTFRIFKGITKNLFYDKFLELIRTPFEQLLSLITSIISMSSL